MLPITYDWLAGFVDGEGTISIVRENRQANRFGVRYVPYLSISNTNLVIIREIAAFLGNRRVHEEPGWNPKMTRPGGNAKPVYRIWLHGKALREHLPRLQPHLRIKQAQADLVLRFLALNPKQGQRWSFGQFDDATAVWTELKPLNKRGL